MQLDVSQEQGLHQDQKLHVIAVTAAPEQRRAYLAIKRVIDLVLTVLLLPIAVPLLACCAVAIRLDSPGPAFFRQQRIGRGEKAFTIYKLRTMFTAAPIYSYKVGINDPRITRVGGWLRRSGLDELPQLWNVLKGEMSLIGPRPELPFIVAQYQNGEHRRHSVRPGITGWWQIHHRNEVPMHLNLEYDFYYLDNVSPGLDLRIGLRTLHIIAAGLYTSLFRGRIASR